MALAAGTVGDPAWANNPATATMLFDQARRLVAAGRYPEACPKFEESQRLDPGIGTQFNLADCYEHTDRIASAWALFLDVASSAGGTGQQARETLARKRAAALEPKLSKLTIVAPRDVTGLEVRRNGEPLGGMLWNNPTPVDPGSYTIEATAPGKKKWSTIATVGPDGAMVSVTIPVLENGETMSSQPPTPPGDEGRPLRALSEAPPAATGDPGKTERILALVAGGAGVVGLGLGSFFGLRSISKHSDYASLCSGDVCAPSAGPLHDDAVAAGNASTVAFVVGGALVAGGVLLWFTAPKAGSPAAGLRAAATVRSSSAGATLAGAW